MSSNGLIYIGIAALVGICIIGGCIIMKKNKKEKNLPDWIKCFAPHKYVKQLNFSDIVAYFKEPKIMKKLQENENYIAVAIKSNLYTDAQYCIVMCIFDKAKGEIVENFAYVISADNIDELTKRSFGNKDMIILQ